MTTLNLKKIIQQRSRATLVADVRASTDKTAAFSQKSTKHSSSRLRQTEIAPVDEAFKQSEAGCSVDYKCNLPTPQTFKTVDNALLNDTGDLLQRIPTSLEPGFFAISSAGGQSYLLKNNQQYSVGFRWCCIGSDATLVSLWRCYVQVRSPARRSGWIAIDHTYIFDHNGHLINPPSNHLLECDILGHLRITYEPGAITQFPCCLQIIKVTKFCVSQREHNLVRASRPSREDSSDKKHYTKEETSLVPTATSALKFEQAA